MSVASRTSRLDGSTSHVTPSIPPPAAGPVDAGVVVSGALAGADAPGAAGADKSPVATIAATRACRGTRLRRPMSPRWRVCMLVMVLSIADGRRRAWSSRGRRQLPGVDDPVAVGVRAGRRHDGTERGPRVRSDQT